MMEDYKARWLVRDWHEATPEHKADRRRYGPMTREATYQAFRTLDLPIPDDLISDDPCDGLKLDGWGQ